MRKKLVLEPHKYTPPPTVATDATGNRIVELRLRSLFHHMYIDVHGVPPRKGTKPLFDEYTNLLDTSSEFLVFEHGIGVGDHKESESQRLGRGFARGYLAQVHGYRWFAPISEIEKKPRRGWSAAQRTAGDQPDWLISDGTIPAIAEAKGTHSSISKKSKALRKWRTQVKNVRISHNGKLVRALKTWIVATRWVSSKQTRTRPKMYCEDPEPPVPLDPELTRDLSLLIAQEHVARNLRRLGFNYVAERVFNPAVPPVKTRVWKCIAPGMEGVKFLGRIIPDQEDTLSWGPLNILYSHPWLSDDVLKAVTENGEGAEEAKDLLIFMHDLSLRDVDTARRVRAIFEQRINDLVERSWFDGCAIFVVRDVIEGKIPDPVQVPEIDDVSLLADGSILAPLAWMIPSSEQADL